MYKVFKNIFIAALFLFGVFFVNSSVEAATVVSGTITSDSQWALANSPYVVDGLFSINPGRTLYIDRGVVVKFKDENSGILVNNGKLVMYGESTDKVYFTSYKDDTVGGDTNGDGDASSPQAGDWKNIYFASVSFPNTIDHIIVRYGGAGDAPAINNYFSSGGLVIDNAVITNNGDRGVSTHNSHTTITHSEISNHNYGIYLVGGTVVAEQNAIHNNFTYGGYNAGGSFYGMYNFWGNGTGPYNLSQNSTGLGDAVSDAILFYPWLGYTPFALPDSTKPITVSTVNGTLGTNDWYVSPTSVTLAATDDGSGVSSISYSLDSGNTWMTYSTALSFGDGTHTILYKATDNAGNIEDAQTLVLKVDSISPVANHVLTGTLGINDWYVSDAVLSLSAIDTNSNIYQIEYSLDAGVTFSVYSDPLTLSNGTNTVFYKSVDNAGNIESSHTIVVKVDTEKPVTTPVVAGSEGVDGWIVSSATMDFTAEDIVSSVFKTEYSLDNGSTWNLYQTQLSFGSGTHTVLYRSVDNAGNTEDNQTITTKVDSNTPVTTATVEGTLGLNDWYTTAVTLSLNAVSEPSGILRTEYSLDNGSTWLTYSGVLNFTDGISTVLYRSINNAGNIESVQTSTFKIDTVKPVTVATVSGTAGTNGWYKSIASVTLASIDATSLIENTEYSLDGGSTWNLYTEAISFNEGVSTILYRSIDKAGNTEIENTTVVKVDTSVPEANIILDPITGDLIVTGIDTIATTTVITSSYALVTNEAGHTLKIGFSKYQDTNKKVKVSITYIKYNDVLSSNLSGRAVLNYHFTKTGDGSIKNLQEKASIGKNRTIGEYKKSNNVTKITEKTKKNNANYHDDDDDDDDFDHGDHSCDDRNKSLRKTLPGLVLVGFKTDKTDSVGLKIVY